MDDGGQFVRTETSVRLSLLKQLLVPFHTGRYVVVHPYQTFSIPPFGRAWHSDEFHSAIFFGNFQNIFLPFCNTL